MLTNLFSFFKFFKKNKLAKNLFSEIESRTKAYLQVSIIKPDVLIDTGDTNFHHIDLYKMQTPIPMNDRIIFYNMIKMYFQNYANSFYVVVNEKNSTQPIVFTVWDIGLEIRIGIFINKEAIELQGLSYEGFIEEAKKRLSIFDGSSIKNVNKNVDRNSFYLIEKSINIQSSNEVNKEEVSKYISILFANFVSNVTKYYFENKHR